MALIRTSPSKAGSASKVRAETPRPRVISLNAPSLRAADPVGSLEAVETIPLTVRLTPT